MPLNVQHNFSVMLVISGTKKRLKTRKLVERVHKIDLPNEKSLA